METRIYYLPKNRISLYLINHMIAHIGCSIGELKVNQALDIIKVPITCNAADIERVERILIRYDLLGE